MVGQSNCSYMNIWHEFHFGTSDLCFPGYYAFLACHQRSACASLSSCWNNPEIYILYRNGHHEFCWVSEETAIIPWTHLHLCNVADMASFLTDIQQHLMTKYNLPQAHMEGKYHTKTNWVLSIFLFDELYFLLWKNPCKVASVVAFLVHL